MIFNSLSNVYIIGDKLMTEINSMIKNKKYQDMTSGEKTVCDKKYSYKIY